MTFTAGLLCGALATVAGIGIAIWWTLGDHEPRRA